MHQAALQQVPLACGDDSGYQVEWEDSFSALGVAVDIEGHPLPQKREVDGLPLLIELLTGQWGEALLKPLIMRPDFAGRCEHLDEKRLGGIPLQHAGHCTVFHPWGSSLNWMNPKPEVCATFIVRVGIMKRPPG